MLRVTGLSAHYGRAHILDDVALEVGAGEVVVLLGRNGAGKSTTMKAIMGLVPPSGGSVRFLGPGDRRARALRDRPPRPRLRAGGTAHLLRADGDGEPGSRPPRPAAGRRALDAGAAVRALPQPRRHARPAGRADERRRAADADHRPHPDGQPAPGAAGRAERGAGARRGGAHGGGDPRTEGGRPVDPAVGAEPAFRPRRQRPRHHHREGPHPLERDDPGR